MLGQNSGGLEVRSRGIGGRCCSIARLCGARRADALLLPTTCTWVLLLLLRAGRADAPPPPPLPACSGAQFLRGGECDACPAGAQVPERWHVAGVAGAACTETARTEPYAASLNACQSKCSVSDSCQGIAYDSSNSSEPLCWLCTNATCAQSTSKGGRDQCEFVNESVLYHRFSSSTPRDCRFPTGSVQRGDPCHEDVECAGGGECDPADHTCVERVANNVVVFIVLMAVVIVTPVMIRCCRATTHNRRGGPGRQSESVYEGMEMTTFVEQSAAVVRAGWLCPPPPQLFCRLCMSVGSGGGGGQRMHACI
jgi:hypothetical protein